MKNTTEPDFSVVKLPRLMAILQLRSVGQVSETTARPAVSIPSEPGQQKPACGTLSSPVNGKQK